MIISVEEGEKFSLWLAEMGETPSKILRKMIFSEGWKIMRKKELFTEFKKEKEKSFIPGIFIPALKVKTAGIIVDKKWKSFRIYKHCTGKWYLVGVTKNEHEQLTTLSIRQLQKLLGEFFEETYYEKIYASIDS